MAMTIPELFEAAVAEASDKAWLLQEEHQLTYADAHAAIGRAAAGLTERGIGQGDLVLATARNRPEYVLLWLAAMYAGAVYIAVNPKSTGAELDGLIGQVKPGLVVGDDEVARLLATDGPAPSGPGPARPDDPAVLIP